MNLIITGSLAFDHIMVFSDKFKNHILPEKIHILNVAFAVENLQKEFGGTAGNIAYNLSLLQEESLLVATAGKDFSEYLARLKSLKINTEHVEILENVYTAQCFITTDLDDNQITAFHGGAMLQAHQKKLSFDFIEANDWVIISPNDKLAMLEYTLFCQQNKLNYIFDPGQSLSIFEREELLQAIKKSKLLIVNDYEWQLIQNKTGLNLENIFDLTENLIVTLADKGSILYTQQQVYEIKAASVLNPVDPTGCGDAYRAGLMFGLKKGLNLEKCAKIGSIVASFAVEKNGTQKHFFNLNELLQRYQETFHNTLIV